MLFINYKKGYITAKNGGGILIKEKEIKQKLNEIIRQIGNTRDIRQAVGRQFILRNLSGLRALAVLAGNLDLNTLSGSDGDIRFLFIFSDALNKALGENVIKLEDYFTKPEIKKWANYKEFKLQESIYPIVFKDVARIGDKIWQTVLTAQELHKLDTNNLLIYNLKTQRNPKITVARVQINLDKKKINEIKERMLSGIQYPDQLKLNIINDGVSRPYYDQRNKTLTLNEDCVINIFDGYHRKTANSLAVWENPDLKFAWPVLITHFTEKQAREFMFQINKQKSIKREYIKQMDYNCPENMVVELIANESLSELAKVMKDDDSYIKYNRGLTKKSIIAKAVKENYEKQLKTSINIRNVADWIIEFTDYLMGTHSYEFIENPYKVKEESVINDKNMFYAYIALSAKLQNEKTGELC